LSPALHLKWNQGKESFLWPQHTINPANFMRQLAIAQWSVRPTINLLNVTIQVAVSAIFLNVFFQGLAGGDYVIK